VKIALHLPLNSTSLGQVSLSILREIYSRGMEVCLFPIGEIDLSTQKHDSNFFEWIQKSVLSSNKKHNRNVPVFKLWHISGSLESFSDKQVLLSFYELDSPTETEINIVKNNSNVLLSSNYSVDIFFWAGCENVKFIPLAFDDTHFNLTEKEQNNDIIQFGMFGKLEPSRKRHLKILTSWVRKYGNKQGYMLNCNIFNRFLDPNTQSQLIMQALNGQKYWNINFIPYIGPNETYNKFINNNDIAIAMSGGEGWGLPEFQSVALGKHCVGLNAHAYKDWMTDKNTVLINPSGKIPVYDNMFFKEGMDINQGNIFDWNEDDFINGLEEVEKRFRNNPVNTDGLELQNKFTYKKMVDSILEIMKSL